jgi:hypothetical protein
MADPATSFSSKTNLSSNSTDSASGSPKSPSIDYITQDDSDHLPPSGRKPALKPDPRYVPPSLPVKTLVVLIGNLRCGELAWTSLYANLLEWNNRRNTSIPHTLDLALVIGEDVPSVYQNASLFARAKYVFSHAEFGDDWSAALDMIDPSWKVKVAPLLDSSSIVLGGVRYKDWHGSGAISFWIRWFLSQKLLEHDLVSRYDRFVITRADNFYMCPHDLSVLDPRFIWVPFGQDFGGITDRHLIVPSQYVLSALNVLPGLFQDPAVYPELSLDLYNPEQLLRDRWKQEGLYEEYVQRFPRMMFTCGNPTFDDSTRWKVPGELVEEGVRKKYRKEYMQSEDTCKDNE